MSDTPQDGPGPEYQPPAQGGYQQPTPPPGYQQSGYPQQPGYPAPGYPAPGYGYAPQYPEESGALAALLMSILGLAVCSGLLCPVGWYLANKEITAIDEGRRDPTKRDMAKAAKIIGIIGSVLLAAGILFFVVFIGIAVLGAAAGSAAGV